MLDRWALGLLAPPMTALARGLVRTGVGADAVTFAGFAIGLAGAGAIALQAYGTGLALLLASRLCDGLDGAVARLTRPSDRGAFLDITLDFLFYASVPLAFALADPARMPWPRRCCWRPSSAPVELPGLRGAGRAARPEEHRLPDQGPVLPGRADRSHRDLACFALMCLFPAHFALWAYGFAACALLTTVTRLLAGWRTCSDDPIAPPQAARPAGLAWWAGSSPSTCSAS
jgi:hypothetical protein